MKYFSYDHEREDIEGMIFMQLVDSTHKGHLRWDDYLLPDGTHEYCVCHVVGGSGECIIRTKDIEEARIVWNRPAPKKIIYGKTIKRREQDIMLEGDFYETEDY